MIFFGFLRLPTNQYSILCCLLISNFLLSRLFLEGMLPLQYTEAYFAFKQRSANGIEPLSLLHQLCLLPLQHMECITPQTESNR
jgi:hypothetical protein